MSKRPKLNRVIGGGLTVAQPEYPHPEMNEKTLPLEKRENSMAILNSEQPSPVQQPNIPMPMRGTDEVSDRHALKLKEQEETIGIRDLVSIGSMFV